LAVAAAVGVLATSEALARAAGVAWAPFSPGALLVGTVLSYVAITHLKLLSRLQRSLRRPGGVRPMLIVGAGEAGVLLSRQIRSQSGPLDVVGFVDDDPRKAGRTIAGLPVLGG